MNGKPGTRQEVAALKAAVDLVESEGLPFARDLQALYDKLTTPFKPRKEGPDMSAVQALLVEHSGGRLLEVQGANQAWWTSLSSRNVDKGMTPENVIAVAKWLGAQPWATGMTVDRVAAGWPSYLARARNEGKNGYQGPQRTDYDADDSP